MQLKHLFVFLLVLVISVAESTVYSQESTSTYYQSSKIIQKRKFSSKTKHIVFNQKTISGKHFLILFFPKTNLKIQFQKEIQSSLKLQKQLHQKIALINSKHTFLLKKISSSNSTSYLYIA